MILLNVADEMTAARMAKSNEQFHLGKGKQHTKRARNQISTAFCFFCFSPNQLFTEHFAHLQWKYFAWERHLVNAMLRALPSNCILYLLASARCRLFSYLLLLYQIFMCTDSFIALLSAQIHVIYCYHLSPSTFISRKTYARPPGLHSTQHLR